jgi:hypothetical protein
LRLLSCSQAVDVSRLAGRAPFFDKLRSGKNRKEHHESRFLVHFVHSICRLVGDESRGLWINVNPLESQRLRQSFAIQA